MTTISTDQLLKPIRSKLAGVRRSHVSWVVLDTITRLLVAMMSISAVSMVIDWYFRLDYSQRLVLLGLQLVFLAWIVYRRLIKPMQLTLSDEELLQHVENEYHEDSHDALMTAVQLAKRKKQDGDNVSAALTNAAIEQGVEVARDLDFTAVIDEEQRKKNYMTCTVVFLILAAAAFLSFASPQVREFLWTWLNRNVAMNAAVQWKESTKLYLVSHQVKDGVIYMTRGEDLVLNVESNEDDLQRVKISFKPEGGSWQNEHMAIQGEQFTYSVVAVLKPLVLEFSGGDTQTIRYLEKVEGQADPVERAVQQITVKLTPRPEFVKNGLSIMMHHPEYTKVESSPLDLSQPVQNVLRGSSLVFKGEVTKPLQWIRLISEQEEQAVVELDGESKTSFEFTLSPEQIRNGNYFLQIVDTENVKNKPFVALNFRLRKDRRPIVHSELTGIGDRILSTARIPIAVTAKDDFGIAEMRLHTVIDARDKQEKMYRTIEAEAVKQAMEKSTQGDKEFEMPYVYDLQAEALALAPDTVLSLYIQARDHMNIDKEKPEAADAAAEGESPDEKDPWAKGPGNVSLPRALALRVVTVDEFIKAISGREKRLAADFDEIIEEQQALFSNTQILRQSTEAVERLASTDWWNKLSSSEKNQRQLIRRCQSIAKAFEQIRLEVLNNRLQGGQAYEHFEDKIIRPLRRLAAPGGNMNRSEQFLLSAKSAEAEKKTRTEMLVQAEQFQAAVLADMAEIKEMMKSLGEFQEAINHLRRLAKVVGMSQKELDKHIKALEDDMGNIFD